MLGALLGGVLIGVSEALAGLLIAPSAKSMLSFGLLIVVLIVRPIGSWFVRVGVLLVLAGIAPVALACYATVWTQGAATLWWRTLGGCLTTPTLQAVAFTTGIDLVINPVSNLPIDLGVRGSDTANLVLVVVMLWVTVKIPAMMRRYVTGQVKGPNVTGIILRTVALQGLTRGRKPVPPTRIQLSTHAHTHHHYRRLRNVYLNRSDT